MRASPRCALAGLGGCACAGERAVLHNRTMPWPPPLPAGSARGGGGGRRQRRHRRAVGHCEGCDAARAGAQGCRCRTLTRAGGRQGPLGWGQAPGRACQHRRRSLSLPLPFDSRRVHILSFPAPHRTPCTPCTPAGLRRQRHCLPRAPQANWQATRAGQATGRAAGAAGAAALRRNGG